MYTSSSHFRVCLAGAPATKTACWTCAIRSLFFQLLLSECVLQCKAKYVSKSYTQTTINCICWSCRQQNAQLISHTFVCLIGVLFSDGRVMMRIFCSIVSNMLRHSVNGQLAVFDVQLNGVHCTEIGTIIACRTELDCWVSDMIIWLNCYIVKSLHTPSGEW